jgi:hypothetical protein
MPLHNPIASLTDPLLWTHSDEPLDAARAFGRKEAIEEGAGSANVLMAELAAARTLLRKYIDHVWQAEGINFIDRIGEPMFSDVKFIDEEKATLTRLANDIAK